MKLRTKLFVLLTLFATAFLGYVHLYWLPQLKTTIIEITEKEYESHLRSVAEGLVPLLLEGQLANVHETLNALSEDNDNWIQLSLKTPQGVKLYPLDDPKPYVASDTTILQEVEIGFLDPPLAILTLVSDLSNKIKVANQLEQQLSIALSLLIFLFFIGIAIALDILVRRPLTKLSLASEKLASGDYMEALPKVQNDEIGLLTQNFSVMREALKNQNMDLRGEIDKHRRTSDALKIAKQTADFQASHDSLTGLTNRREFERQLSDALSNIGSSEEIHTLFYIDLDQFKVVNDTCGHAAGDELLKQVTDLLSQQIREQDVIARLGGDEFGIILKYCSRDDALMLGNKICTVLSSYRFSWKDRVFTIGASIGGVQVDNNSHSIELLLSEADSACYMAKEKGRNRVHFFSATDEDLTSRKDEMLWSSKLTKALQENTFLLYAQPILPLQSKDEEERYSYEILLRLNDDGNLVLPGAFIPAAERYGIISEIDRWVFDAVVLFLLTHRTESQLQLNINLSGLSLGNMAFLRHIETVLISNPSLASMLCFEVTESEAVRNLTHARYFIDCLRQLGCSFALDDFGTGMCSFNYLKNLPVDYLKIDGSFVREVTTGTVDRITVKSINEIGVAMGMKIVAEFVESEAVKITLEEIGVTYGQGYHLGKPAPLTDVKHFIHFESNTALLDD